MAHHIDPFDRPALDVPALDVAWRSYHHGSVVYNAAANAMTAAGITWPEACHLLDAPTLPSLGVLAGRSAS